MPFVDEFLRLHPNISLDISFNDEVQDLIEARIDLSIRIGILPDSSIHARKLASQTRSARPAAVDCGKPPFCHAGRRPAADQYRDVFACMAPVGIPVRWVQKMNGSASRLTTD